ncbi:MAG: hypothetical protein O2798_00150 [Chloroflexi bacterium]|nr:hypothetical protein [Chloroflexota bacterium]MDA1239234.1 hypothetical protein [Chloroflexota bacterium]
MKRVVLIALTFAFGLVAVACSTPDAGPVTTASDPVVPAGASSEPTFPTGPAVIVEAGYVPPEDRVDSTGAFLPANGKPTLVYVDAIW